MLLLTVNISAQTSSNPDKHVTAMQRMLLKLINASSNNFVTIKGSQENQQGSAIFFKVNLTSIVTDAAEMKEALATDFFGAMLTNDDHIVVTPSGTLYLARYVDDAEFPISDIITQAFMGMPSFLGNSTAKIENISGQTSDQSTYILTYNNIAVGKLDCNKKSGKSAIIIGLSN